MDATYHYPPELFQLLVDTIPRLCKSKRGVFTFFRGAGVETSLFSDVWEQWSNDRDSVNKFDIARTVITRLNEGRDKCLKERREVVKRVVEFEDFSTCWESDRLEAQGLVSRVRDVVNVKDSFTRMRQEREAEIHKNLLSERAKVEALNQKKERLRDVHRELLPLFSMDNPQERGRLLEKVLNRLFKESGFLVREDFQRASDQSRGTIEQIDGVIEVDGEVYLVEMKWLGHPAGVGEISQHLSRVFNRGECRGLFISGSGYSDQAIENCKEHLSKVVFVLCTLQEIVLLLENEADVYEFLKTKILGAVIDKQPFTEVLPNT